MATAKNTDRQKQRAMLKEKVKMKATENSAHEIGGSVNTEDFLIQIKVGP
jgi:hypothetical protein